MEVSTVPVTLGFIATPPIGVVHQVRHARKSALQTIHRVYQTQKVCLFEFQNLNFKTTYSTLFMLLTLFWFITFSSFFLSDCMCGTSACNTQNGMTCMKEVKSSDDVLQCIKGVPSTSTVARPQCTETDGARLNDAECECGGTQVAPSPFLKDGRAIAYNGQLYMALEAFYCSYFYTDNNNCPLADASIKDTADDASVGTFCQKMYRDIPRGWSLVPASKDVITNVVDKYSFGTTNVVFSNGDMFQSGLNEQVDGTLNRNDEKFFIEKEDTITNTMTTSNLVVDSKNRFKPNSCTEVRRLLLPQRLPMISTAPITRLLI